MITTATGSTRAAESAEGGSGAVVVVGDTETGEGPGEAGGDIADMELDDGKLKNIKELPEKNCCY